MKTDDNSPIRVELHLHTCYSDDSLVKPDRLVAYCRNKGIDKFAITDHNEINGALEAQAIAPEHVIVGEEILTTEGELLGYFVSEKVPAGLTPMATIERLKAQGAVVSVAHPFDPVRSKHWTTESLLALAPYLDAVEIFNSRCLRAKPNAEAKIFAAEQGLPGTVGSDAHVLWEIGRATLLMPDFQGPDAFISALAKAEQEVRLSPYFVHGFSKSAYYIKKLQKLLR
jgi:predicted metal-dependent phosphoesterase TrpH